MEYPSYYISLSSHIDYREHVSDYYKSSWSILFKRSIIATDYRNEINEINETEVALLRKFNRLHNQPLC